MRVTNPDLLRKTTAKLWQQLNVAEPDRPLVLAWLIAAIANPNMPHPILSFSGEQGTAKSTTTKRIVELSTHHQCRYANHPKTPSHG
jgi:Mg-chelatase subunit ChlI